MPGCCSNKEKGENAEAEGNDDTSTETERNDDERDALDRSVSSRKEHRIIDHYARFGDEIRSGSVI